MENIKIFFTILVLGPILDFVWFGLVASDMYKREVGSLLQIKDGAIKIEFFPAILVYILIALLVTLFVLPKVAVTGSFVSVGVAFLWGALAGLILYGVYDFTNLAFLKDWTIFATVIDIIWGTFMVGAVSAFVAYLFK